ncbi:MAG: heparin lyase I family protein [Isosphaeraceae bacterium]
MPDSQTTTLDADVSGPDDAYTLIRRALGPKSIETGDFLGACHRDFTHIRQDTDDVVGDHFVFFMHLEQDCEPVHPEDNPDRQRCEIKVAESAGHLQGKEGDTFSYSWLFRIDGQMPVSKHFTHLFQLKSVGGDDGHPVVTITGEKEGGVDTLQVRWSPSEADTVLARHAWASARDRWLQVWCQAKFARDGFLKLSVKSLAEGTTLLHVDRQGLSLWRGGEFVRPKWGIYRRTDDPANLRPDEESVRFARISITREDGP